MDYPVARPAGISVSRFHARRVPARAPFHRAERLDEGRLLRAQTTEMLGYFAAGNNPSGIFSLSCLAKTVVADEALRTALDAVRALERRPAGAFSVELRKQRMAYRQ